MRTTVTLDDDLHTRLERRAQREGRSFREVLNETVRRALTEETPTRPYRVQVHHARLGPGIDPDRLNQLVDELDSEEQIEKLARSRLRA